MNWITRLQETRIRITADRIDGYDRDDLGERNKNVSKLRNLLTATAMALALAVPAKATNLQSLPEKQQAMLVAVSMSVSDKCDIPISDEATAETVAIMLTYLPAEELVTFGAWLAKASKDDPKVGSFCDSFRAAMDETGSDY